MKRVLFIITQSEMGGAQRYLLELAPYLSQEGYEIAVAAGEGNQELFDRLHQACNIEHETFFYIPTLVRNLHPVNDIRALWTILKLIKNQKPDILFLQSTKAGFLGSLAAKIHNIRHTTYNIRVIYRIGGWSFRDPRAWWMNTILFWMEKISARWKDVIVVNSEYDRKLAVDKKIAPAKKIVKIYNGIDVSRLHFLPREEARRVIQSVIPAPDGDRSDKGLLIGIIANLYATKGIEYLIEAARILYKLQVTSYKLLFIVIGEGKQRPYLEALIKQYGLKNNFFLVGRVPNASQYLKAFDIFVLPSVKEGMPWTLLETMAAGVPIVSTNVGAIPEVIEDGKDGLLVAPRDSKALAKKISDLLNRNWATSRKVPFDNDRDQMVQNAQEKLKKFTLQKMLEESEKIICLAHELKPTHRSSR